jgi:hypothetical protein
MHLHQFSATAGAESYGVAYADYTPGTDWKCTVDGKRDSIVSRLGASVVDEKRTSVAGYPGKWVRFVRTEYERGIGYLPRRSTVVLAARFYTEEYSATTELL